ncbi:LysR family transcriptional regulator [Xenophilus sp. Marseille-Q4582]|uniref:LysR family transcriptional regulator n=1 Tax=Xenophilus sp. Marseille-Q4582 TaxID=2866600 RepID=UPI001CE3BFDE|nr:LysR family transcriptional regulator [Xenophilus sp. Marseille-Q4582]
MKMPNTADTERPWADLHWLGVLAQQGSYTAAAQRLGVSKAAVSQRIAALERAAGVPLVQRTTRSLRLTEAGQRLVEETRAPFEAIAHSFAGVRDLAGVPRGRLRITAPVALARQQLVPRLPDFLRAQPEVRVELELSDRLSALSMEGLDLAIRHTAAPPDTHVAWALCRTRTVLVASRAYLRRRGTPQAPQDLQAHDCLYYPRGTHQPAWHFLPHEARRRRGEAAPARTTVAVAGPFCANNSEALRDAAIAGLGIALLPDFSAQAALQAGKLVQVLTPWESVGAFGEHIYAIRPYAPHVPRAVGVFVDWLRVAFEGGFALPGRPAGALKPCGRSAHPAWRVMRSR